MTIEAGVLVGTDGNAVYWHLPRGRTFGSIPDSRDLWDVIWEGRDRVLGFAHSHPGRGRPSPSHEDVTTFEAVESALGRRLTWWITSADRLSVVRWAGPGPLDYAVGDEPPHGHTWLPALRIVSGHPGA